MERTIGPAVVGESGFKGFQGVGLSWEGCEMADWILRVIWNLRLDKRLWKW